MTTSSLFAIISGAIYLPDKCVIVTGQDEPTANISSLGKAGKAGQIGGYTVE